MRKINSFGSPSAQIMVVADCPNGDDEWTGTPLSRNVGKEFDSMLHEAGILRGELFITNVCRFRPPQNDITNWVSFKKKAPDTAEQFRFIDGAWVHPLVLEGVHELRSEIERLQPNIIIGLGNLSLWALTGNTGIGNWRGSLLKSKFGPKCIPTYHPSQVCANWEWRSITVHDLRRARRESDFPAIVEPQFNFIVRPSFDTAIGKLRELVQILDRGPTRIAGDLETRNQDIACVGLAWSKLDAICIPIQSITHPDGMYWTLDEHKEIRYWLSKVLEHPNIELIGQNFSYDQQYFLRRLFIKPNVTHDTMVAQHVLLPGTPKGLDYLSSLYCENHVYWKEDGKEWNPKHHSEDQLWIYNCTDCVRTYEVWENQEPNIAKQNLTEQYRFQMSLFYPTSKMTTRGIRINTAARDSFARLLEREIKDRNDWMERVIGYPLNVNSPKQMKEFLYEELGLPPVRNRKAKLGKDGKKPITANAEALEICAIKQPLLRPIVERINDLRTMRVFLSTFVNAPLDDDGRIRCTFQFGGPETYRFSSYENSFGTGTNLQNIPRPPEEDEVDKLPSIRKLFIPDEGYEIADVDLSGADAMVVAWECDDQVLKEIMAKKLKLAAENAKMIYGGDAGPDGKREPYYTRAKQGCHATNYGANAYTVSAAIGITVHEAERFQERWFAIHPNIRKWHKDVERRLQTTRTVWNRFGYRRIYFDRVEGVLPEALAWIPQSTVACAINRALVNIDRDIPEAELLLQVHDSLVFQYKKELRNDVLRRVRKAMQIVIAYDPPLIIPSDLKVSQVSWGECEKLAWPTEEIVPQ